MTNEDKPTGRHSPQAVELDAATKARIRAEEVERLKIRAELAAEAGVPLEAPSQAKPQPMAVPPAATQPLKVHNDAGTTGQTKPASSGTGCITIGVLIVVFGGLFYACSGGSSGSSTPTTTTPAVPAQPAEAMPIGTFGQACQDEVLANLKAPATGAFPNYYTDQEHGSLSGSSAAGWQWYGYVDAENSFGANIRTYFGCKTDPGGTLVHVNYDK